MSEAAAAQKLVQVYPLKGYAFGSKAARAEKGATASERIARYQREYERQGPRRAVEGVLVVAEHNHPHVLLLQCADGTFKLPGGRLRPGEGDVAGLKRKLTNKLSPTTSSLQVDWEVSELLGTWWRPSAGLGAFPYVPAHCTKPRECRKVFVVQLPDKCHFAVPKNLKLMAVPLFELYDNATRFGPIINALPVQLSRLRLNTITDT